LSALQHAEKESVGETYTHQTHTHTHSHTHTLTHTPPPNGIKFYPFVAVLAKSAVARARHIADDAIENVGRAHLLGKDLRAVAGDEA
jgi:hypothetical protein